MRRFSRRRVFQQKHENAPSLTVDTYAVGELMFHAYDPGSVNPWVESHAISPVLTRAEAAQLRDALNAWLRGAL